MQTTTAKACNKRGLVRGHVIEMKTFIYRNFPASFFFLTHSQTGTIVPLRLLINLSQESTAGLRPKHKLPLAGERPSPLGLSFDVGRLSLPEAVQLYVVLKFL